jgi:hypothetical protein
MAARSCSERGSGGEANERQGRAPEGVLGFIWSGWSRCRVHLVGHGWARGAAFLGRCCELSAALGVAASVAKWFGRDGCVFRTLACETARGELGRLGCGAVGALQRALDAVHGRVRHEANGGACVRER